MPSMPFPYINFTLPLIIQKRLIKFFLKKSLGKYLDFEISFKNKSPVSSSTDEKDDSKEKLASVNALNDEDGQFWNENGQLTLRNLRFHVQKVNEWLQDFGLLLHSDSHIQQLTIDYPKWKDIFSDKIVIHLQKVKLYFTFITSQELKSKEKAKDMDFTDSVQIVNEFLMDQQLGNGGKESIDKNTFQEQTEGMDTLTNIIDTFLRKIEVQIDGLELLHRMNAQDANEWVWKFSFESFNYFDMTRPATAPSLSSTSPLSSSSCSNSSNSIPKDWLHKHIQLSEFKLYLNSESIRENGTEEKNAVLVAVGDPSTATTFQFQYPASLTSSDNECSSDNLFQSGWKINCQWSPICFIFKDPSLLSNTISTFLLIFDWWKHVFYGTGDSGESIGMSRRVPSSVCSSRTDSSTSSPSVNIGSTSLSSHRSNISEDDIFYSVLSSLSDQALNSYPIVASEETDHPCKNESLFHWKTVKNIWSISCLNIYAFVLAGKTKFSMESLNSIYSDFWKYWELHKSTEGFGINESDFIKDKDLISIWQQNQTIDIENEEEIISFNVNHISFDNNPFQIDFNAGLHSFEGTPFLLSLAESHHGEIPAKLLFSCRSSSVCVSQYQKEHTVLQGNWSGLRADIFHVLDQSICCFDLDFFFIDIWDYFNCQAFFSNSNSHVLSGKKSNWERLLSFSTSRILISHINQIRINFLKEWTFQMINFRITNRESVEQVSKCSWQLIFKLFSVQYRTRDLLAISSYSDNQSNELCFHFCSNEPNDTLDDPNFTIGISDLYSQTQVFFNSELQPLILHDDDGLNSSVEVLFVKRRSAWYIQLTFDKVVIEVIPVILLLSKYWVIENEMRAETSPHFLKSILAELGKCVKNNAIWPFSLHLDWKDLFLSVDYSYSSEFTKVAPLDQDVQIDTLVLHLSLVRAWSTFLCVPLSVDIGWIRIQDVEITATDSKDNHVYGIFQRNRDTYSKDKCMIRGIYHRNIKTNSVLSNILMLSSFFVSMDSLLDYSLQYKRSSQYLLDTLLHELFPSSTTALITFGQWVDLCRQLFTQDDGDHFSLKALYLVFKDWKWRFRPFSRLLVWFRKNQSRKLEDWMSDIAQEYLIGKVHQFVIKVPHYSKEEDGDPNDLPFKIKLIFDSSGLFTKHTTESIDACVASFDFSEFEFSSIPTQSSPSLHHQYQISIMIGESKIYLSQKTYQLACLWKYFWHIKRGKLKNIGSKKTVNVTENQYNGSEVRDIFQDIDPSAFNPKEQYHESVITPSIEGWDVKDQNEPDPVHLLDFLDWYVDDSGRDEDVRGNSIIQMEAIKDGSTINIESTKEDEIVDGSKSLNIEENYFCCPDSPSAIIATEDENKPFQWTMNFKGKKLTVFITDQNISKEADVDKLNAAIHFQLKGIEATYGLNLRRLADDKTDGDVYPHDLLDIRILDFEIEDRCVSSTWLKFLTRQRPSSRAKSIKDKNNSIISIQLKGLFVPPSLDLEYKLLFVIEPLRLFMDQDAVNFLVNFFNLPLPKIQERRTDAVDTDDKAGIFFQSVSIGLLSVRMDYKPKQLPFSVSASELNELIKVFSVEDAQITLPSLQLYGICGWHSLMGRIYQSWIPQLTLYSQASKIIHSLSPIRSVINLSAGVMDLIILPIQSSSSSSSLKGLQRGTRSLWTNTGQELLKLSMKFASRTTQILEKTDQILDEEKSDKNLSDRDISIYASPPTNLLGGAREAYSSLEKGIHNGFSSISSHGPVALDPAGTKANVMQRDKIVSLKAIPIALMKPVLGTSKAISKALQALYHASLSDEGREDWKNKYKTENLPFTGS